MTDCVQGCGTGNGDGGMPRRGPVRSLRSSAWSAASRADVGPGVAPLEELRLALESLREGDAREAEREGGDRDGSQSGARPQNRRPFPGRGSLARRVRAR